MSRFKQYDIAVIARGPTQVEQFDEPTTQDPAKYHFLLVGSLVKVVDVYDRLANEWGTEYMVQPLDHTTAWSRPHMHGESQFVFDIHLAAVNVDLSPTSVEDYLNGAADLVGGIIQSSETPFFNPLNGNE